MEVQVIRQVEDRVTATFIIKVQSPTIHHPTRRILSIRIHRVISKGILLTIPTINHKRITNLLHLTIHLVLINNLRNTRRPTIDHHLLNTHPIDPLLLNIHTSSTLKANNNLLIITTNNHLEDNLNLKTLKGTVMAMAIIRGIICLMDNTISIKGKILFSTLFIFIT